MEISALILHLNINLNMPASNLEVNFHTNTDNFFLKIHMDKLRTL